MEKIYSQKLHKLIPGGSHTYSRGDDQFPYNAPSILEKGEINGEQQGYSDQYWQQQEVDRLENGSNEMV